jgi:hypothetical protein
VLIALDIGEFSVAPHFRIVCITFTVAYFMDTDVITKHRVIEGQKYMKLWSQ